MSLLFLFFALFSLFACLPLFCTCIVFVFIRFFFYDNGTIKTEYIFNVLQSMCLIIIISLSKFYRKFHMFSYNDFFNQYYWGWITYRCAVRVTGSILNQLDT